MCTATLHSTPVHKLPLHTPADAHFGILIPGLIADACASCQYVPSVLAVKLDR